MDGNQQSRNSSVRPLRSPPSSASSAGVGPHHDSLSPSSPSPSLDSSSSESHYNIPGDRAPVLKTGKGSATAKSAGSNSEEVPLLGGERIEAVYKELTYLCPYRYGTTNFSVNKKNRENKVSSFETFKTVTNIRQTKVDLLL